MKKLTFITLHFILSLVLTNSFLISQTTIYSEDFTTNPGFIVDYDPGSGEYFEWDSEGGFYKVRIEDEHEVEKFAFSPQFNMIENQSFQLTIDINRQEVSYGQGFNILFFNNEISTSPHNNTSFGIHHSGSQNPKFSISDNNSNEYETSNSTQGIWYRFFISFNNEDETVDLIITERETGVVFYEEYELPFAPNGAFNQFTLGQRTLYGEGDFSEMRVDNILIETENFQDDFNYWDTNNWEGNKWCQNSNQGNWTPSINNGFVSITSNDLCWTQIRSIFPINAGNTIDISLTPFLESGGTNWDGAYFALSTNWVVYNNEDAVGVLFKDGNIIIWSESLGEIEIIGQYLPGSPTNISLFWDQEGSVTVTHNEYSYTIFNSFNDFDEAKFVVACKDSDDGILLDQISIYEETTPPIYSGPIWHISVDGSDQFGNGSSDYAFSTIQHAMDLSSDGDTILVGSGTYFEQIIDFHDYELVVMSVDGPEQTILDCNSEISGPVVLNGHQSEASVLSGFTIQNCYGNEAAIRIENGAATIENMIIRNNSALSGGGLFSRNYNGRISNSVFYSNSVENEGGGLLFWNSNPILNQLTIVSNQSNSSYGCGIFLDNNSNLLLTNSIIWNNSNNQIAFSSGDSESNITIEYSNIQNGTDGINVFDNGTYIWGEGNIVNNPLFLNETNDFNLSLSSPCIGSGSINYSTNVDIIGNPRPNPAGSNPDLGAYEHELAYPITNAPLIFSIEDIPDDQGGWVRIQFIRSLHDTDTLRSTESYTIEIDDGSGWTAATSLTGYAETFYSALVHTTIDSSSSSDGLIEFRVIAGMEEGNFASEVVQGYSVDNIIPLEPTNLTIAYSVDGITVSLNWDANQDEDLEKYRIYRNGVVLDGEPVISEYLTEEIFEPGFPHISYHVTAVDIHGNESHSSNDRHLFLNDLTGGNSLISIPAQLENSSTQHALDELLLQTDYVNFMIGQGVGLFNIETGWSGNLNELSPYSGYWINSSTHDWVHDSIYTVIETCELYPVTSGNNLLSFKWDEGSAPTLDALGGEAYANENFNFIIGQGVGLFNTETGWSGNLNNLEEGKGYWLNVIDGNIEFKWGFENCGEPPLNVNLSRLNPFENIPEQYQFTQSTEQSFYLFENVHSADLGDIVIAYCGEQLVGSAVWNGKYTPVPVMGRDISELTVGFCEPGEIPNFYLYKDNQQIKLNADIPGWSSLGVYTIDSITEQITATPDKFNLAPAYPNPFNPITTINYAMPEAGNVNLAVFNLDGQWVGQLFNSYQQPGYHTLQWNAVNLPSGVYFVRMQAGDYSATQKVLLLK